MGPMQTKTPGGCTYVVTLIDDYSHHVTVYFMKAKSDLLSKFKIYKAAVENATDKKIKRPRSDIVGKYTGRLFKGYINRSGMKHEKTVQITPQQNGLAECMNRGLMEMARCILYHDSIEMKWWAEALKNLKVFAALGYVHIPDEKRRKLDANAFKCRFMGYEDDVKRYCVQNVETGKVQIVRTVKFVETTSPGQLVTHQEEEDILGTSTAPTFNG
ncbi:hypothetical protein PC129_g22436 [Phytophthora cactorum]|uniref:Integrase catalytic domain-containing protein n=1 Tax=Phytophthora cactorum TaxID=29920 RepID=A0A329RME0_9STRA|nr:hypothetical protein PC112_g19008 [Phytophthora cactorum]KAG2850191.1 hypothetical protein PC113_g17003 [Phytophthora cactorum]KAG2898155.1 hypothetical protein PC115_g16935 [Phytophthora cactorum]KAG2969844.1 hypothetical protein PC118_g17222 [Phytophthora cactorum]KAG2985518.1 hypothetical protein PC119_g20132 [Phytophthora cactorum]